MHLIPARPCPFYSQGRCLFSDSCNFLHDVKIKVRQPQITVTDSTPAVTISSPQASSVTASPVTHDLNVRSPPRSPRLSSLLLALGDAIQAEDSECDEPDSASIDEAAPSPQASHDIPAAKALPAEGPEETAHASSDPVEEVKEEPDEDMTHAAIADSDRGSEPSDLLSPIEVKLGQLDGPSHREDSIDSGYADNWIGPSPFALSPPKPSISRRYSTLSLLSSPFGSPVRALSPKFGPSSGSAWPSSPLFSPVTSKAGSRPSSLRLSQILDDHDDDLDSPTDYDRGQLSASSPALSDRPFDEDVTIRKPPVAPSPDLDAEQTVVPPKKPLDKTVTSSPIQLPEKVVPEPSTSLSTKQRQSVALEESPVTLDYSTSSLARIDDAIFPEQSSSTSAGQPEESVSETSPVIPTSLSGGIISRSSTSGSVEPDVTAASPHLSPHLSPASVDHSQEVLPEPSVPAPVIDQTSSPSTQPDEADAYAESAILTQFDKSLLEEDATDLYNDYYSEALYTNSPRNVELYTASPVVPYTVPQFSSPSPHPIRGNYRRESESFGSPTDVLSDKVEETSIARSPTHFKPPLVATSRPPSIQRALSLESEPRRFLPMSSKGAHLNEVEKIAIAQSPAPFRQPSAAVSPSQFVQRALSLESEPHRFLPGSSKGAHLDEVEEIAIAQSPARFRQPSATVSPSQSIQTSFSLDLEPRRQTPGVSNLKGAHLDEVEEIAITQSPARFGQPLKAVSPSQSIQRSFSLNSEPHQPTPGSSKSVHFDTVEEVPVAQSPIRHKPPPLFTSPSQSIQRNSPRDSKLPEFVPGSSKDVYADGSEEIVVVQSPTRYKSPSSPLKDDVMQNSPIASRQSTLSQDDLASQASRRVSTKVPFGFRHSMVSFSMLAESKANDPCIQARPRDSPTSRPGSAPPTRHRPPALVGLSSGRSQSMNDNSQLLSPELEEQRSSSRPPSRLKPLRLVSMSYEIYRTYAQL